MKANKLMKTSLLFLFGIATVMVVSAMHAQFWFEMPWLIGFVASTATAFTYCAIPRSRTPMWVFFATVNLVAFLVNSGAFLWPAAPSGAAGEDDLIRGAFTGVSMGLVFGPLLAIALYRERASTWFGKLADREDDPWLRRLAKALAPAEPGEKSS